MFEENLFNIKLRKVLMQLCAFGFTLFALIQAQDLTRKNVNVRQMFDGVNVQDNIVNYTFDFNTSGLCPFEKLYFKKDFTSPGRRISEVKCLEYIWDSMFMEYEAYEKEVCDPRIIAGGRPALYGEFPHMGALGWKSAKNDSEWVFMCGASLISERFMLTAAHCSYVPRRANIASSTPGIVKLGDNFIVNTQNEYHKDVSTYVPIKRIIKHGRYMALNRYYDIALIELAEAVNISALIRPACLWSSSDTSPIDKLTVTGWGVVDPATRKTSNELQVAEVNLVDDSTCENALIDKRNRKWIGLAEHQICAGFMPGGVDTCQGDSGGPLQVRINLTRKWPMYYVVGVTSFGYGCARANMPSVYVRTSSFMDWIESIVWARQMFDGVNVQDIVNYTLDFNTSRLCPFEKLYYKKDFTSPGRRISEVKCLEYTWDSMFMEYEAFENEFCDGRINAGGTPALYGEFPHMGALGWKSAHNDSEWVFMCGASLISERFMLTAAHCSFASWTPEIVKLGDSIVNTQNEKHKDVPKYVPIKRIIKHGQYMAPIMYYDIALIELAEAVHFGALIRPACLWSSSDTNPIDKLTVTRWGVVDPVTRKTSNKLQVAEVNLVDDSTCDKTLKDIRNRRWMGLAEHQICAGFLPGAVDTCQGESGGPLQLKINLTRKWPMYYVVGVKSFGYGCAHPNIPSVYAKTSSFVDWIESIVWPNA